MFHENMSHVTDIVEYYISNVMPEFYDFHFGNSLVTNLLKTFQLCFLARVLGIELPVYFFYHSLLSRWTFLYLMLQTGNLCKRVPLICFTQIYSFY